MIITNLSDGLGNQLFQYAFGRVLSLYHGVPLKTNPYWFKHESNYKVRRYGLSHFGIDAPEATWQEIDEYIFADTQWHRLLKPYYKRIRIHEQTYQYDSNVWKFPSRTFVTGYWQAWRYYADYQEKISSELRIVTPPSDCAARLMERIQSSPSVAIHIRRGDYLSNPMFNVLPKTYYNDAITFLQNRYKSLNWYVFSDDPEWKSDFVLPQNVTLVTGLSDIDDFRLMNATQHAIIANSTFSWWAAWLKTGHERTIIAPKQPFRNASLWSADDLFPPHFVRL
ncbi:alpha-1,2-fucosyltransferase [Fibrella aquatilis]|uniref:Alpha-1,2-fucosyltransferase n=1 Tax=Fibrella aquatilis TaxID=2817059 RepID=A0A939GC42_9BACT|nr:alpha-1,2-fucosyltransferase [Fibrella aquatilis]MBO0933966.1 alpha-1,2-fucosyltransferase [Fibrella aquatilis]